MSKGKILLDAGHYAKRNQSPAVPEYYESERMWMLHRMLQARLELLGFDVAVTREEQAKDLSVTARGKMAEGYDLMLSLHSNAEDSGTVDRVVIYEPVDASDEHTQFALTRQKLYRKSWALQIRRLSKDVLTVPARTITGSCVVPVMWGVVQGLS